MKYVWTLCFLWIGLTGMAQNGLNAEPAPIASPEPSGIISGTVFTIDQRPAAWVNVSLKGSQKITITDERGHFRFAGLKAGNYVLEISMVGLQKQEKAVNLSADGSENVTIILNEDNKELDQVIIKTQKNSNNQPVSVGKIDISPMNLPQSIAVIGQTLIRDQQAMRLSEVIRNVNGVYLSTTRGNVQESFAARGYNFSSTNLFRNGSRVNAGAMPEMSSLEKVEVLKGSAAILFGNVAPGGIVNMVTKQPRFENGGEISLRAGSYGLFKPAFDIYGPITGNIAFRVNGTYENSDSYRNQVHTRRYFINPSFLFRLSQKTDLLVQGDYLRHNFTPDFGIGTLDNTIIPDLPRSTYLGTPWAYNHARQGTASATLKHQFTDNWKLTGNLSYQRYTRDYYSTERIQAAKNGTWARPLGRTNTRENYYIAQVDVNGKFNTGNLEHKLLVGMDADRYHTDAYTFNQPAIYDTINVLQPATYNLRTDMPPASRIRLVETPVTRFGAYVQDLISISNQLKLLAGVRWSYQEGRPTTTTNLLTGEATDGTLKVDKAFSPRLGLVFRPLKSTSFFVSYANSFSVNTGTDVYGNALSPSIIDQYEAGIKNEFFGGKVMANLTVYRIRNNNLAQTAAFAADGVTPNNNTNLKELTGETTSDGIEVDLGAHPWKGFDFNAGYSYNYMRYTKTPDAKGNFVEGERLVNTPAHTANASLFYTVNKGKLKGLKLGSAAFYTGNRFGGWNNTIGQAQNYNRLIPVDGFTTVDLSAGYNYRKLSLLVKVSNLTNTYNYYVHENYSINPIPPRQIISTLSFHF